jgi:L-ascorbate metabolism protein UlaG (beta-lactamase superfamily)
MTLMILTIRLEGRFTFFRENPRRHGETCDAIPRLTVKRVQRGCPRKAGSFHKEQKMKMLRQAGTIAFMVILMGTYRASGNEGAADGGSTSGKTAIATPTQLLTGIVHLSDNDLRFQTTDGIRVFVDPLAGPADERVVKIGAVKPDLILLTHSHADHFQPEVLRAYLKVNPKAILAGPAEVAKLAKDKGIDMSIVTPGQDYTMAGIRFRTVPAYFSEGQSHPKANLWVGYVLQINKARYYVTGDTEPLAEMAQTKADVLFPLLWGCGGNIEQAVKMAAISKARVVVPVHTTGSNGLQEDIVKKYLAQLPRGVRGVYYKDAKLVVAP